MALLRFGGGRKGIKEYLEHGKKQGRTLSRDELDQRIVLVGDLDICDKVINSRETDGEKYDHITFSFQESEVSEDVLRAIAEDLKTFALAAHNENELYFYAEAHIPRTATEKKWDAKTRRYEIKDRHPHIHAVIPKTNLITGGYASAFELLRAKYGTKDRTQDFTDAFQEYVNEKYQLASPKDHRRDDFTSHADILSRVKEDQFNGRNREALATIRDAMLNNKIESPEAFRAMLEKMGRVSVGHGRDGDYLQIQLPGRTQNVRLKDYQFSNEFLAKPMAEKLAFYSDRIMPARDREAEAVRRTELLSRWIDRAREIKYLSPSSRFFKELYVHASPSEKRFVLDKLEAQHHDKLREDYGYANHGSNNSLERPFAAGLGLAGRERAREVDVSAAVARNLRESSRNLAAVAVDHRINADAVREHVERVAEATATNELASGLRGRAGENDQERGLDHGNRRERNIGSVRDNLRAADENFGLSDGLGAEFWEAAIANRANLEDDATARRYEAYGNGMLNSIYLRTTEQLNEAALAGERIIENPGTVIDALTWADSYVNERKLTDYLMRNTADHEQFERTLKAVLSNNDLVVRHDEKYGLQFTSHEILQTEQNLIELAKRLGSSQLSNDLSHDPSDIAQSRNFNAGQSAAFSLLCGTRQLAVVNGAAGTGKSYVLKAMKEAYERDGFAVYGAILQGKTAEDLERDSGIECRTIARMLIEIKHGKFSLNRNSVLVVDEAGMVGSRQLEALLRYADSAGSRIRLIGDDKQIAAVEYGNAYAEVSKHCEVVRLTEIVRQDELWMRKASEKLATHHIDGFNEYVKRGHIEIAETILDAQVAVVDKWDTDRKLHPDKSRIVLAHTNESRFLLNEMMRDRLKDDGLLRNEVDVHTKHGILPVALGEQLTFTAPDSRLGVKNGTIGHVVAVRENESIIVKLPDGTTTSFRIDGANRKEGVEIDYGYAATIHKSQGMTVDRTFVLAEKSMTMELLYVSLTRHRSDVRMVASAEEFKDMASLSLGLQRQGNKVFSYEEGREWKSTERPEDSLVGQMLAEITAEKVIKDAAQRADYKELIANLEAQRVLDHVEKSHGINLVDRDIEAVVSKDGLQRIRVESDEMDVTTFLVKKMNLNYRTQAAPILRQCYGEQLAETYANTRYVGTEIDQELQTEFSKYRQVRDAQHKISKDILRKEKVNATRFIEQSGMSDAEKKSALDSLNSRIKEARALLKGERDKKDNEVYREWLASKAPESEKHLKELWRVAVTPKEKELLASLSRQRDAEYESAKASANDAISKVESKAKEAAEHKATIKAQTKAAAEAAHALQIAAKQEREKLAQKERADELEKGKEQKKTIDKDLDHGKSR